MVVEVLETDVFPREVMGRTFYSAEEIEEFIKQVRVEGRKVIRESKGTKKGRVKGPRRLLIESVVAFLNDSYLLSDEMSDSLKEKTGNPVSIGLKYDTATGQFYHPTYSK
jgi:hypothetical protein